jgi:5-methylthioadenosine/S-adenosylhomocysteine deaminase
MIKSGTTCFGDMYFFADEVGRAVELSGIKSLVSSVVVDLLPENIAGLKVLTETLKKVRQLNCSRVIPWIGPHSPYSCSEETLKKVKEISKKEKLRINIHLSESESEIEEIKNKYEKNPVEFLDDLEFLDSSVVAAHCVHLTEKEMKILREKDVKVVHNPVSNMKTASGVAPVPEMLQKKICVALGTDGAASNNCLDLFQEMKFAALLHKINKLNPTVIPAERVLDFATVNGARALGLESQIGSIETGKKADIIILNVKKPNMTPILSNHSITSHLVYSATGNDVETSIVDGKIIMENRKVLTLKEEDVIEKSQEVAEDLQSRTSKPL